jgi:hypothetical protein
MTNHLSEAEARLALSSIERRRLEVIAEIDVPRWYWWGLAGGWVVLGVLADVGNPWASAVATLAFGAAHASVAHYALSGRHRSRQLSVHRDMVDRRTPALVMACLVGLAAVTTALGFVANADGADHPGTIASVVVAVAVLCGGPTLMAAVRRRAARRVAA